MVLNSYRFKRQLGSHGPDPLLERQGALGRAHPTPVEVRAARTA